MKKFLVLAVFLVPSFVFAHELAADSTGSTGVRASVSAQAAATNPVHDDSGNTVTNPLYEGSDKPAPTARPVATPGDCDDSNDANCDRIAPSPLDQDTDGDTVPDDIERQTPKRDLGDRMKAGLHSIGSFFSRIVQWGHSAAKSIIQNMRG